MLRRAPRSLRWWILILLPVVLICVWLVWWLIDAVDSTNKTPRGLKIQSSAVAELEIGVGGLTTQQVAERVEQVAEQFARMPIQVIIGDKTHQISAKELGLEVDVSTTVSHITQKNSSDTNPVRWAMNLVGSYVSSTPVDLHFVLNTQPAQIRHLQNRFNQPPVEPVIVLEDGAFKLVPGSAGYTVDIFAALPELLAALNQGQGSFELRPQTHSLAPQLSDEAVRQRVLRINDLTSESLAITVEGITKLLEPAQLQQLVFVHFEAGQWLFGIHSERLNDYLTSLFSELAEPASAPVISIDNNVPVLVSNIAARLCCELDANQKILTALSRKQPVVELALRESDAPTNQSWLTERGIVELVGRFTTFHNVHSDAHATNIERIADLLQGTVVYPGETFSVNQHVGERTPANGFVSQGEGISQVVTTLFTAAFDAGMDFPDYTSHSTDIPSYRRGLDATISWPEPDFKLRNPHPYSVLLWPTVTSRTITVSLYSTAYVEVQWTGRYEQSEGSCLKRTTERTRTYADGNVVRDSVVALYGTEDEQPCIFPRP